MAFLRSIEQIARSRTTGSSLTRLWRTAERLRRLQEQLLLVLPDPLRDHITVVRFDGGLLTLCASSPAWASNARFALPALQRDLLQLSEFAALTDIRLRIATTPLAPATQINRTLSADAASLLRDCAATTPDPELRAALEALARHASNPGEDYDKGSPG